MLLETTVLLEVFESMFGSGNALDQLIDLRYPSRHLQRVWTSRESRIGYKNRKLLQHWYSSCGVCRSARLPRKPVLAQVVGDRQAANQSLMNFDMNKEHYGHMCCSRTFLLRLFLCGMFLGAALDENGDHRFRLQQRAGALGFSVRLQCWERNRLGHKYSEGLGTTQYEIAQGKGPDPPQTSWPL